VRLPVQSSSASAGVPSEAFLGDRNDGPSKRFDSAKKGGSRSHRINPAESASQIPLSLTLPKIRFYILMGLDCSAASCLEAATANSAYLETCHRHDCQ